MLAEEWFADYMRRANRGAKQQKVLSERRPREGDRPLWMARAYDAETDALLAVIRANRGRGRVDRGVIPAGSEGAAQRLLAAVVGVPHVG
ncbi:hypothetical protein [Microbacterium allomyrinae]|uniref:Uncharacterized protein n=1 Tax=Microbacterium allomyrinae TaxID=2830666 RepID=A0A9X1S4H5_9MICO|nr:hypothetical protein [Microbacterium allomyrinae]MCC2033088.1 hypothetical protein [Microbacterium allomyrinae]